MEGPWATLTGRYATGGAVSGMPGAALYQGTDWGVSLQAGNKDRAMTIHDAFCKSCLSPLVWL
jgi:hypothetical protein